LIFFYACYMFKKKDQVFFNMKNMDLAGWGPSMWRALHAVSFTADRGGHLAFFEAVPDALPCPSCGVHLREIYSQLPIDVSSVDACSRWLWRVHHEVNRSLGKPTTYTYEELLRDYTVGVPVLQQAKKNWMWIVWVLLALMAVVFMYWRCK
jgi:hypothetical protein